MDRKKVVSRNNPYKREADFLSPLTVGNGSIAYTVDVTGMQTLYDEQAKAGFPLLTMSDWGWHTIPVPNGTEYDLDRDFVMTEYAHAKKGTVKYAVEKKPGNEHVYDWLRQNPHRYNLLCMGLLYKGETISVGQIQDIKQELDLYSGIIYSSFLLDGQRVEVKTLCHQEKDVLGFEVNSVLCERGELQISLRFPYGSPDITGSDWDSQDKHETRMIAGDECIACIEHLLDNDSSYVSVFSKSTVELEKLEKHSYVIRTFGAQKFSFSVAIAEKCAQINKADFLECQRSSIEKWQNFWTEGGLISFEGSTDPRAKELERRIILSLYLSAINSACSMPPQETGLTVNSWYGKAHLEMYLWHLAYAPLWGRNDLLKKSLGWYKKILPKAIENAQRNGYKGAKWPKMVGPEGVDCPSKIATLLVWQQPHLIYMLELIYQTEHSHELLEEYWELIKESAEYMVDFAEYNAEKDVYELIAPLIPAQERHKPYDTKNPVYEIAYWKLGLQLAVKWAKRLNKSYPAKWQEVADKMAKPTVKDGVYLAHELCDDTYTVYAEDHPSMVAALGLLPGEDIDKEIMSNTLEKIYQVWNFKTMWGWDFAMMAMTETRLGNAGKALDILLYDTAKNQYMTNGHNLQVSRKDLPLYLPGNGSLLLAIPLMAVGYPGCKEKCPGFPDDGTWQVETEGIKGFVY